MATPPYPWHQRPLVMGIINATDDSFSGDGVGSDVEQAVAQGLQMLTDGAEILDIGGESTRRYSLYYQEGQAPPQADEELARVIPIIKELRKQTNSFLSIDTNKIEVAEKALEAGIDILNYAWGGAFDNKMLELAHRAQVPICIMHNATSASYGDVVDEVLSFLIEKAHLAETLGIPSQRIILDPGIGFQKSVEDSVTLLRELKKFTSTLYPILLGASRKSVIWKSLQTTPDKALAGSLAVAMHAVQQGVGIIRTHDVKETVEVVKMAEMLKNSGT